jgi:UDP-N-acetylglucosamine 2-epimerase (non-hydrolysing)
MHKLLGLLDNGQARHGYRHIYVHSGQHFDYELDGVFYRDLQVRQPDLNLRIGRTLRKTRATSHVYQSALLFQKTARMLERFRPSAVLYLGDTNTVLSAIIVAKYNIPVIHIEGGGRSYDWRMPEEKNRITIDHLSDLIYCYLDRYREILLAGGVPDYRVVTVGNIIVDAIENFLPAAERNPIMKHLGLGEKEYGLCTLHREENIENAEILAEKLTELQRLSRVLPVVFPVMPRVRARIRRYRLKGFVKNSRFIATRPLGHLEFLKLEKYARVIITDSGTVQEEALILGVPCLVTRRSTERPETMAAGATILADGNLFANARRTSEMDNNWDRSVLNSMGGSPSKRIFQDIVARISSNYFPQCRTFHMLKDSRFVRQAYGLDAGLSDSSTPLVDP